MKLTYNLQLTFGVDQDRSRLIVLLMDKLDIAELYLVSQSDPAEVIV
jgi:hypothetical protein